MPLPLLAPTSQPAFFDVQETTFSHDVLGRYVCNTWEEILANGGAPFDVIVTPTNVADAKLSQTALEIADALEKAGFDVLLDDRDERPGVKFKDADLIGIPFRINVGKKVTEGRVEVVRRSTRESLDATISEIPAVLMRMASQS